MLVDGSTVSMPDTEENQKAFPQSQSQGIGLGFPVARVLAIICAGSVACILPCSLHLRLIALSLTADLPWIILKKIR